MALQEGLYRSQEQQEADLLEGPGWTMDQQRGSGLDGLAGAIPRGIGQGVADGVNLLAHGMQRYMQGFESKGITGYDLAGVAAPEGAIEQEGKPYHLPHEALEATQATARGVSQSLMPDPRTTGTAANVVQGFSKAVTEFGLGSVAGGPAGGAAFLGATEGYAHYQDMLDAGVDEETAKRSGLITAVANGAGALMPFGLPAKWLAGLSAAKTLGIQAATGVGVNTGFGIVNRYAQAQILRNAGYDAMADQMEPMDKESLLADAISGAFFGAHSGWHGFRELQNAKLDPSLLDAAKVVQDRQEVLDRAPGVPVDPKSAAVHREHLGLSMEQLLAGQEHVDLSELDSAGAAFAQGDVDESAARKIIRDAFTESPHGITDADLASDDLKFLQEEGVKPPRPPAPADRPVNPIDPNATNEEKLEQIHALTKVNKPIVQSLVDAINEAIPNAEAKLSVKSDKAILGKTERPSILAKRPWWGMEHLADTLRFKSIVESLHDFPKVVQVLADHGIEVVKVDRPKLEEPNAWGWRMLPIDLRMPNGQLVEHYIVGKHLDAAQEREGHDLFEKWRYRDENQLTPEEFAEYHRDVARSDEIYREAWDKDFGRPGETLTDARASLDKASALAESLTRTRSSSVSSPGGSRSVQEPSLPLVAKKPSAPTTAGEEPSRSEVTKSSNLGSGFIRQSPGNIVPQESDLAWTKRQLEKTTAERFPELQTERVATATGRQIEVRPRVVEAADLITSDRPEYPQELQPRQRGARAALAEQVRGIARNLNPELLGRSAEADRGAPITGPGNTVESGNGRVMALREVYANHPEKAQAYRDFLEREGYDTKGFKEPVLIRERVGDLDADERRAFTVEANQSSTAALSPVERAQADARLLDADTLSQMKSGDVSLAGNAAFVRSFMSKLPESERNAMVNPDGTVSQEGVRRIQSALLAKAYGGAPESNAILGRMLESTDQDMRSVLGALLDAAPAFAKLRQAIEDGKLGPEYDISKAVALAVEKGYPLEAFLKQQTLFEDRKPVLLMQAFFDKSGERLASREAMAQKLILYANRAMKQRLDQNTLFGEERATPEQMLAAGEKEMKPGADMFGLRTPQGGKAEGPKTIPVEPILADRPNLQIPDENGAPALASDAHMEAQAEEAQANKEADPMHEAAAACEAQHDA